MKVPLEKEIFHQLMTKLSAFYRTDQLRTSPAFLRGRSVSKMFTFKMSVEITTA